MALLINCSNCWRQLQLPPGASFFQCTICGAITYIAKLCYYPLPQPSFTGPGHHFPSSPPPPPVHGRKRAVICGISYKNTQYELKGCINDAKWMKYMLTNRFNFPESSIFMLTDEETNYWHPTKQNIMTALRWLVWDVQPGDSLVFHFSGHGSQQKNVTGDEIDGFDEMLCPLDSETAGMIIDDEINETIVRPLPHGAKLHAIIDSCNSGTMLDLPFLCKMDRDGWYSWEDHRPPSGANKGTSGGEVICFSACEDGQKSAEIPASVTCTGAMTFSFIDAIEKRQAKTYGDILECMRSAMLQGSSSEEEQQEPQLSSNDRFYLDGKQFSF